MKFFWIMSLPWSGHLDWANGEQQKNIIWLLPSEGWEFRGERRHTNMCVHAQSFQLCLTLCIPTDCSPPGSSDSGISQARMLEWVAISFSRRTSPPRDRTHLSCLSCTTGGFFTTEASEKPTRESDLICVEGKCEQNTGGGKIPSHEVPEKWGGFLPFNKTLMPFQREGSTWGKDTEQDRESTCRGIWLERWEGDRKVRKEVEIRTYWLF